MSAHELITDGLGMVTCGRFQLSLDGGEQLGSDGSACVEKVTENLWNRSLEKAGVVVNKIGKAFVADGGGKLL
jgi:hypothetical protein